MKSPKGSALFCALLGLLTACGQSAPSPGIGGRPPLPTGVTVSFPAAPQDAYLTLSTDEDEKSVVVHQQRVPAGATSVSPDPVAWSGETARAQVLTLPGGQQTAAKLLFLKWGMYQDLNKNAKPDAGEWLNLMTHDRVTYASEAMTAEFDTEKPPMHQSWRFSQGWSRAEHYVYLPIDSTRYQRLSHSTPLWQFQLHAATPYTSM